MKRPKRLIKVFMAMLMLVVFSVGVSIASESTRDNDWRFDFGLYFWGASVGGQATSGEDIDVDLDDILDSLELAFMGVAEVGKGKWSLTADAIYLDIEDSAEVDPGVKAEVALINWVVTPFVSYTAVDHKRIRLNILGGARYLYMDTDLKLNVDPVVKASDSESNWDGIIGIRGGVYLTKHWYIPYHLDIGTGDSDLTWQAYGGIGYQFKHIDLVVAYRYLSWDFDDNMGIDDMYFHGPMAGIKFRF